MVVIKKAKHKTPYHFMPCRLVFVIFCLIMYLLFHFLYCVFFYVYADKIFCYFLFYFCITLTLFHITILLHITAFATGVFSLVAHDFVCVVQISLKVWFQRKLFARRLTSKKYPACRRLQLLTVFLTFGHHLLFAIILLSKLAGSLRL